MVIETGKYAADAMKGLQKICIRIGGSSQEQTILGGEEMLCYSIAKHGNIARQARGKERFNENYFNYQPQRRCGKDHHQH